MAKPFIPPCTECGSTTWSTTEYFSGIDGLTMTIQDAGNPELIRAGLRYNAEQDDWECENGHQPDDDTIFENFESYTMTEILDEARSEL